MSLQVGSLSYWGWAMVGLDGVKGQFALFGPFYKRNSCKLNIELGFPFYRSYLVSWILPILLSLAHYKRGTSKASLSAQHDLVLDSPTRLNLSARLATFITSTMEHCKLISNQLPLTPFDDTHDTLTYHVPPSLFDATVRTLPFAIYRHFIPLHPHFQRLPHSRHLPRNPFPCPHLHCYPHHHHPLLPPQWLLPCGARVHASCCSVISLPEAFLVTIKLETSLENSLGQTLLEGIHLETSWKLPRSFLDNMSKNLEESRKF